MENREREAFLCRVVTGPGCWEWVAHRNEGGYGTFSGSRGVEMAHRAAWRLFCGPVPDGLTLDHLCRNRACVRPSHLEPVTLAVNILRGEGPTARHARKVVCKRGHPFSGENLIVAVEAEGIRRRCRACRDELHRQKAPTFRLPDRACAHCGAMFRPRKVRKHRFCSARCLWTFHNGKSA